MAGTTDPRASGFNATQFRDAIRFAMNMGLPQSTLERVTFRWTDHNDYAIEDPEGLPYKFTATPILTTSHVDVLATAAVEFVTRASLTDGSAVGSFDTPRAIITILDEDYVLVDTANRIVLGGNTYKIDFVAPPFGLFDVTVWQIHCTAMDES
jgi:hypothetical protein